MSFEIPSITPTASPFTITLPGDVSEWRYLVFKNESAFDLQITYGGGSKVIAAWTADYLTLDQLQAVIPVHPQQSLPQVTQPNELLTLTVYGKGDALNIAQYPTSLTRITQVYSQSSFLGSIPLGMLQSRSFVLPPSTEALLISPFETGFPFTTSSLEVVGNQTGTEYYSASNIAGTVIVPIAPGADSSVTITTTNDAPLQVLALSFTANSSLPQSQIANFPPSSVLNRPIAIPQTVFTGSWQGGVADTLIGVITFGTSLIPTTNGRIIAGWSIHCAQQVVGASAVVFVIHGNQSSTDIPFATIPLSSGGPNNGDGSEVVMLTDPWDVATNLPTDTDATIVARAVGAANAYTGSIAIYLPNRFTGSF